MRDTRRSVNLDLFLARLTWVAQQLGLSPLVRGLLLDLRINDLLVNHVSLACRHVWSYRSVTPFDWGYFTGRVKTELTSLYAFGPGRRTWSRYTSSTLSNFVIWPLSR